MGNVTKAFLSEDEFEEAYERFLADLPQAGRRIADCHERMESSFRDYLDAFEKWVFRHAYESGYAAAVAGAANRGTEATDTRELVGQRGDRKETAMEQLRREALYAQRSFSEELLYKIYGGAVMAQKLGAITKEEFMEINDMTVRFMKTDREFIRRKNEGFLSGCDAAAGKEGQMKGYRVRYWLEDQDGREEHMEFDTMEQAQAFYNGLGGRAEIQKYIEEYHGYEAVVHPTFEV